VTVQIKVCWHKNTSRKMQNLPRKTMVLPVEPQDLGQILAFLPHPGGNQSAFAHVVA
jgi:hypothetical protein